MLVGRRHRDGPRRLEVLGGGGSRRHLGVDVDHLEDVGQFARLDAGGVEHVASQCVQPAGVRRGTAEGGPAVAVGHDVPMVERGLEEAQKPGDGGAQLVGHDAHEFLAHGVDLSKAPLLLAGRPQASQQEEEQQPATEDGGYGQEKEGRAQRAGEPALELGCLLAEDRRPADRRQIGHGDHVIADVTEAGALLGRQPQLRHRGGLEGRITRPGDDSPVVDEDILARLAAAQFSEDGAER